MTKIIKKFLNNFEDVSNYYNYLVEKTKKKEYVGITNEWLIDNFYLLVEHKMGICENKKEIHKHRKLYDNLYFSLKDIVSKYNYNISFKLVISCFKKYKPIKFSTLPSDEANVVAVENDKIVIFGGGTGKPFFSTDTGAALRAIDIGANVIVKLTNVDGVYDKDPHKYDDAKKYDTLTFSQVIADGLAVMDSTAAAMCRDNKKKMLVFDLSRPDNIYDAVMGENIGTVVSED